MDEYVYNQDDAMLKSAKENITYNLSKVSSHLDNPDFTEYIIGMIKNKKPLNVVAREIVSLMKELDAGDLSEDQIISSLYKSLVPAATTSSDNVIDFDEEGDEEMLSSSISVRKPSHQQQRSRSRSRDHGRNGSTTITTTTTNDGRRSMSRRGNSSSSSKQRTRSDKLPLVSPRLFSQALGQSVTQPRREVAVTKLRKEVNVCYDDEASELETFRDERRQAAAFNLANPINQQSVGGRMPVSISSNESGIKCSFYPNCLKPNCTFLHPKKLCLHFPNCNNGDSCRFLHPLQADCKFGFSCTNQYCTFKHPTKSYPKSRSFSSGATRTTTPVVGNINNGPAFTPCRFGIKCTKDGCQYQHELSQLPCKFGMRCKSKVSCPYGHALSAGRDVPKKIHKNMTLVIKNGSSSSSKSSSDILCRFDGRCNKIACLYKHTNTTKVLFGTEGYGKTMISEEEEKKKQEQLFMSLPSTP